MALIRIVKKGKVVVDTFVRVEKRCVENFMYDSCNVTSKIEMEGLTNRNKHRHNEQVIQRLIMMFLW